MKESRPILASAIAAALGAGSAANAATVNVALQSVISHSSGGTSAANISSSTATWSYNTDTDQLWQTSGLFDARFNISPFTTLFRHSITGLMMGGGGGAAATSFTCAEGNFGAGVGASLCGNYNFGANYVNESAASYGPGTSAGRTLGGDDMILGAQQTVSAYNGMTQISWVGTTLTLSNATPTSGYTWTLSPTQQAPPPPPAPGFSVSTYQSFQYLLATGISNLEIGGTRYNVSFCGFDCDSYAGAYTFLGDRNGAIAAAEAINGALHATGVYDVSNGIWAADGDFAFYSVAYSETTAIRGCNPSGQCDLPFQQLYWSWDDASLADSRPDLSLVVFSQVANVPAPAAAWLFGGALISLNWLKRQRTVS